MRIASGLRTFRMLGLRHVAAVLFLAPAIILPVAGAEIIGTAETISNRVTGELPGARRVLAPAADVHLNEIIRTEAQSAARLRFADNSDLRLGPQAQIRLDGFVFSGKPNAAMQLTRGALRFFSGSGPTGSYQIRTPVATIGLRGTGIGVVLSGRRAYVTLLEGAARVCTPSGQCSDLVRPCDYVAVDRRRADPARPLTAGVPTFSAQCTGPACGPAICAVSAAAPSPSRTNPPAPGLQQPGYDPAGGSGSGGSSSGAGGNSGGGGGKGR